MHAAVDIYKGMLGMNGSPLVAFFEFGPVPSRKPEFFQTLIVGLFICLALPPTITLQRWVPQSQALAGRPRAATVFTVFMALVTVLLLGLCVSRLGVYSPFLYFQF
jgi:alginate O-acetyltransferase complex protein AlgI